MLSRLPEALLKLYILRHTSLLGWDVTGDIKGQAEDLALSSWHVPLKYLIHEMPMRLGEVGVRRHWISIWDNQDFSFPNMDGKWTAVKKINKSLLFAVTQMSQSIEPNRQAWSQWTGAASEAIKGSTITNIKTPFCCYWGITAPVGSFVYQCLFKSTILFQMCPFTWIKILEK